MAKNTLSFSSWLASKKAVSFTLAIGVVFLVSNYQHIIFHANPDTTGKFSYPFPVLVILSHIDSLFFGMTTAIMMFQAKKEKVKILYCCMEALMIFLNLNQLALRQAFTNPELLIRTYIAVFSGFSFYFLGTLMVNHYTATEQTKREIEEEEKAIEESLSVANAKK